MTESVRVSVADRIATVTLERPPVNAFNAELFAGFHAVLDDLAARKDWSVLHVRSALEVFSGGADLAEVSTHFTSPDKMEAAARGASRGLRDRRWPPASSLPATSSTAARRGT
jgi:enoyl-CoA hydratase/carnithine racemase